MPTAFLYKSFKDKIIECAACYHRCKIPDGKTGLCGVRKNIGGQLELLVYGQAAAAHADPIEKKPLYHFWPGSLAFSIGTFGCNFRCLNCQNYDISQILNHPNNHKMNWGDNLSPTQAVQAAKKTGCQSIAYTYNEPTIWTEYALTIMKLAKKSGLDNVWVSNGYMTAETLKTILPYLNAINVDLKSFDEKFYQKNCGARLEPVLQNCRALRKNNIHLEITTLIIPGLSDDEKMLARLAKFIHDELGADVPWHISAFSGEISWQLRHLSKTSVEKLKTIRQIGLDEGLNYIYVGNIMAEGLENTLCPKCAATVIERRGYNVKNHLKQGACGQCGYRILNPEM